MRAAIKEGRRCRCKGWPQPSELLASGGGRWGERLFQALVRRGRLRLGLQSCPGGSSRCPALLRPHPPASGACLPLPCNGTAWGNRLADFIFFIRYFLIILFRVLCNGREIEKPKWPNRIVKASRDLLGFYHCWLSGTGLEVKKTSFWKTTQLCGLEGYWIFYVENTGSLMGH